MKLRLRRQYWSLGMVLLGAGIFAVLVVTRPQQRPPPLHPRVWRVDAIVAHPRRLRPVLTLYGEVRAPALMRALAPKRSRVVEVRVRPGQTVRQGQILARLDERDFQPEMIRARAQVADLDAEIRLEQQRHESDLRALRHERKLLDLLQVQVARLEKLRRRNLGSETVLDQARMEVERQALAVVARRLAVDEHPARLTRIEARLERARADLINAELDLERSRVDAPFAGVVAEVPVAAGDYVQLNQPLVSLYPLNDLEVWAKIPAPFQGEVRQALMQGAVLPALGESHGTRVGLRLDRLAGKAESGGIDALFRVTEGNEGLRIHLPVSVHLERLPRDHAVPVPYAALYGSDRIYRIVDGRLRPLRVTPLGEYPAGGGNRLLVASRKLVDGDLILVTHLPAAVDGLVVQARVGGEERD